MFKRVLIANRGAIAVRIEKTLKKMNIESVAIYTKADEDSLHVDMADKAIYIGDGAVSDTYLNSKLILDIAKENGVDAIHPGYGFLSEDSNFARACMDNGIAFIGPTPEQMETFGLKHEARKCAAGACVPMLEGTQLLETEEEAVEAAEKIGYPVIVKSTAGGGGIGMKICEDVEQLKSAYHSCIYLAQSNFSSAGVYLEKYLKESRHIEVQIFGNEHGEVVALYERDCSVQRRNQKVIEESPAPGLREEVRVSMMESAVNLAKSIGYRSAGTVEFLYDNATEEFYFLEVNTRLQVEHGVTEEVLGIDLVEWMVKEAAGELTGMEDLFDKPEGCSIQARIYAEDAFNVFMPSAGKIDKVLLPEGVRIESWIQDNTLVTHNYDPMLVKMIIKEKDRETAVEKLIEALEETRIFGITTNVDYLKAFMGTQIYQKGDLSTKILEGFTYGENKIEVLDGGVQTTIQDYPSRVGYWDIGVPPSGAMDNFSFRIGNAILNNPDDAPGMEMTLRGGKYKFRDDMVICLTGADMSPELDGESMEMYAPISVKRGQILKLDKAKVGMRAYLLVKGGLDVPKYLGSASTFVLGGFGGHGGRTLRAGDLIHVNKTMDTKTCPIDKSKLPAIGEEMTIGVVAGPHCTTEFLQEDYLDQLTETAWEVHFNSDRTGVRLMGPTPLWERTDGGEAGLHPSNIHDTAYAVGTLDLTGDMPIILGPDGPSLGGFVCPVTVSSGEYWKVGQLAPGSIVRFKLITIETAEDIRKERESYIENIKAGKELALPMLEEEETITNQYPLLKVIEKEAGDNFVIRCAGDEYLLCEYGDMEIELRTRIRVHALMEAVQGCEGIPLIEVTPGIRSLQIHIDSTKMSILDLADKIVELDEKIGDLSSFKIKSRKIRLPLSWDDPAAKLAVERYHQNVRPNAPWCPSNIEFIRRINGLDSIQNVYDTVFNATYLVMGLGDVYLGAPVCIPLDPRHRLVTTKYNPARTWTPENAVGIGGAYMGIYGMEGPGGYQLVGRTIQTWNSHRVTDSFQEGKPWLLNFFDQISYYPVSGEELLQIREDFLRGKFNIEAEETEFSYGEYLTFLEGIKEEGMSFKRHQQESFDLEREMWREKGLDQFVSKQEEATVDQEEIPEGSTGIYSNIHGSVWKILLSEGDVVKEDEAILIEESMKMEFEQKSDSSGVIEKILVKEGQEVHNGQLLAIVGKGE